MIEIGKTEFINAARELECQGLLKIEWEAVGVDIRRIRLFLYLARSYEMSGIRPKFQVIKKIWRMLAFFIRSKYCG